MRSSTVFKLVNSKFLDNCVINKDLKYNRINGFQSKHKLNNYYVKNGVKLLLNSNKEKRWSLKKNYFKGVDTTSLRSLIFPRFIIIYHQHTPLKNTFISNHLKLNLINRLSASINSKF